MNEERRRFRGNGLECGCRSSCRFCMFERLQWPKRSGQADEYQRGGAEAELVSSAVAPMRKAIEPRRTIVVMMGWCVARRRTASDEERAPDSRGSFDCA